MAAAREHIFEPDALDGNLRHEYAALVCATLQRADTALGSQWENLVQGGLLRVTMTCGPARCCQQASRPIRGLSGGYRPPAQVSATRSSCGDTRRSHRSRSCLAGELEAELGAVTETDFPFATRVFMGPQSPTSATELAAKSAEELVAYLRGWNPDPVVILGPSREGLGRELTQALRNNPTHLGNRARDVAVIDPTYARAVLQGWEQALRDRRSIPWQSAMDVIEYAVSQPDEGDVQPSALREQDPGWRWSHREAAASLEAGLRADTAVSPPASLRDRVWAAIAALSVSPDPTIGRDAQTDTPRDAATDSLNTVRGRAMRAVVAYLSWLEAYGLASLGSVDAQSPEALALLDEHLDPVKDAMPESGPHTASSFPICSRRHPWSRSCGEPVLEVTIMGDCPALGDVRGQPDCQRHRPNRDLYGGSRATVP